METNWQVFALSKCNGLIWILLPRRSLILRWIFVLVFNFHESILLLLTHGIFKTFVERQVEKLDPVLDWLESEFGFKPVVYSSFSGGKQEDGLVKAIEDLLKKTNDSELAAIDAIAAAAHSLVIAVGMFRGKLQIEEAIELIRLEEDLQVRSLTCVSSLFLCHTLILCIYTHTFDCTSLISQIFWTIPYSGINTG